MYSETDDKREYVDKERFKNIGINKFEYYI